MNETPPPKKRGVRGTQSDLKIGSPGSHHVVRALVNSELRCGRPLLKRSSFESRNRTRNFENYEVSQSNWSLSTTARLCTWLICISETVLLTGNVKAPESDAKDKDFFAPAQWMIVILDIGSDFVCGLGTVFLCSIASRNSGYNRWWWPHCVEKWMKPREGLGSGQGVGGTPVLLKMVAAWRMNVLLFLARSMSFLLYWFQCPLYSLLFVFKTRRRRGGGTSCQREGQTFIFLSAHQAVWSRPRPCPVNSLLVVIYVFLDPTYTAGGEDGPSTLLFAPANVRFYSPPLFFFCMISLHNATSLFWSDPSALSPPSLWVLLMFSSILVHDCKTNVLLLLPFDSLESVILSFICCLCP